MAPTITLAGLRALKPCSERYDALKDTLPKTGKITAWQAKEAGATFNDLIWVASALAAKDKDVERRVRLWLADCAAHVLHIYEKTGTSPAPRDAIIAARQYARGEIDDAARVAAVDAAVDAAGAAAGAAAWAAARVAAGDAAVVAAWAAAGAAAGDAAVDAAGAAAGDAAGDAERKWQEDRLIAWLSDPEPEDLELPEQRIPQASE